MADKCKECGCICKQCNNIKQHHNDMHLHVEIENLRQRLLERDSHIVTMETQFLNEADKFPNGEVASLREELHIWQDKYSRLYEAHKRVQKVNQNLEDKLLKIVDKCETEKGAFTKDIATLSHRLADANYIIHRLTKDNEKYRADVNLAIQLLQCKPSNFIGQKYEKLPSEVQAKVRSYITEMNFTNDTASCEVKSITVPISTFPPTAMVYNVTKPVLDKQDDKSDDDSKPPVDVVSATVMAKILEDREKERIFARHCITCTCHRSVLKVDSDTQTVTNEGNYFKSLDSNGSKSLNKGRALDEFDEKSFFDKHNQGNSLLNDMRGKESVGFHVVNEVAEAKKNVRSARAANQYENLKSIRKQCKRAVHEGNASDKVADREENNAKPNGSTTEVRNPVREGVALSDQAKIDMINERLWKSNWSNSKDFSSYKDNEGQLDVINERAWKNNSSNNSGKSYEKSVAAGAPPPPPPPPPPPLLDRLTVIEVKSVDDSTNCSEKANRTTDTATSPTFSGESLLISSSDPSSLSSEALPLTTNQPPPSKKQEQRVSGPRNCLMRVTPGSRNVLLDNAGAFETVLYTSGHSRPNTALVHLAKSSGSGRSASISSEENSPGGEMHEHTTHLRVAQWVDTLSSEGSQGGRLDASAQPLLLRCKSDVQLAQQPLLQADLMTFEASSDEEHRLGVDLSYQGNISEEIEQTYLKLAASLDSSCCSQQASGVADFDMMTLEKYRNEQKRSHKNSQAKFQA